jgi:hypothetical protein
MLKQDQGEDDPVLQPDRDQKTRFCGFTVCFQQERRNWSLDSMVKDFFATILWNNFITNAHE